MREKGNSKDSQAIEREIDEERRFDFIEKLGHLENPKAHSTCEDLMYLATQLLSTVSRESDPHAIPVKSSLIVPQII